MAIQHLQFTQIFPATLSNTWQFFADPRNLARISPPALDFQIQNHLPEHIYAGLMIEFSVRPFGFAMRWLTEITQVAEGRYFIDEQRVGPFSLWHHEHHFRDLGEGRVEMRDLVTYIPLFGPLGGLIDPFYTRPRVRRIFAHRASAIAKIFS